MLIADARNLPLRDESIDCVVTSPPYFGLRAYGDSEAEMGRASLVEYLELEIRPTLTELLRVAKPRATTWFNIGDTASGSGGAGGDYNAGGGRAGRPKYRQGENPVPKGQWTLVPQRVALIAQDVGFYVRSWITWNKGHRRPESLDHVKRPGISSEIILMLAKRPNGYVWNPDALTDPGDVWTFPSAKGQAHLAPFPDELPRRCILLSTHPGDVVLDPFVGSGTTVQVAEELGRVGVGFDLYDFS